MLGSLVEDHQSRKGWVDGPRDGLQVPQPTRPDNGFSLRPRHATCWRAVLDTKHPGLGEGCQEHRSHVLSRGVRSKEKRDEDG